MSKPPHKQRGQQPQQTPAQHQVVRQELHHSWSGPLPPPEALEKFNQVVPDGAARIVAMAEKEQTHRIEYERVGLTATIREAKRGQILGACISALAIAGAIFTAYIQAPWQVPVALVGVTILGIVQAIIRPRGDK